MNSHMHVMLWVQRQHAGLRKSFTAVSNGTVDRFGRLNTWPHAGTMNFRGEENKCLSIRVGDERTTVGTES